MNINDRPERDSARGCKQLGLERTPGTGNDFASVAPPFRAGPDRAFHGVISKADFEGLQRLAEGFSNAGTCVFLADVKGDLAGLSQTKVG